MQFSDKARRVASLSSRIARLQKLIADRPEDEKLFVALAGLAKRAEMAREALSEYVEQSSIEVVDYRIRHADESYPVKSVAESLSTFQSSITAVYDAITTGPKRRARFASAVQSQTTLNFEFFYPGSKGFILSVPSEMDLFGGVFDRTTDAFNDFLDVSSAHEARDASRYLGLAAVSTLFAWVSANARWGNSVDYEWKARKERVLGRHISVEKFLLLQEVFLSAEDFETQQLVVRGVLVGLDVQQRTFHFSVPDGDSYKGKLHSDYPNGERSVPHMYFATINMVTRMKPATGEEIVNYELLSLDGE